MSTTRGPRVRGESGFIASWLAKTIVAFAVVGVVLLDAGSMLVNFFTLDSTAKDIALELSGPFGSAGNFEPNPVEVQRQARVLARDAGARLLKAEVTRTGGVRVRLKRTADTIVAGRIGMLDAWTTTTADGEASGG